MVLISFVCLRCVDALTIRGGLGIPTQPHSCRASLRHAMEIRQGAAPRRVACDEDGTIEDLVALASVESLLPDHVTHVMVDPLEWIRKPIGRYEACLIMRGDPDRCRSFSDLETYVLWCDFNKYVERLGKRGVVLQRGVRHFYTYEAQRIGTWTVNRKICKGWS